MDNHPHIDIYFYGKNATEVTGSCILIETSSRKILLECGLYQSINPVNDFMINSEPLPFNPAEIDYVFCNHTHVDHIGRLPILYKNRCSAPLIMPKGSHYTLSSLLYDCAKITRFDAKKISHKTRKKVQPYYSDENVDRTLRRLEEYECNVLHRLDDCISFMFVPAGHILNSAQLILFVRDGDLEKKILYTSDLGNTFVKKYYVQPFEKVESADVVIGESTYGDTYENATEALREQELKELKDVIRETCFEKRGTVLIPVFANSRAQELMTVLYDMFSNDPSFRIPVILDTALGEQICMDYLDTLEEEDLHLFRTVCAWKKMVYFEPYINRTVAGGPAVVLASSGMLNFGPANNWCKSVIKDPSSAIVFCGYSPEGSLAEKVKDPTISELTIEGKKYKKKCRILDFHSFSSHMQREALLDYYSTIDAKTVFLVHGDASAKSSLAKELESRLKASGKDTKIIPFVETCHHLG